MLGYFPCHIIKRLRTFAKNSIYRKRYTLKVKLKSGNKSFIIPSLEEEENFATWKNVRQTIPKELGKRRKTQNLHAL